MRNNFRTTGFSIIEIIIVVATLSIILAVALPQLTNLRQNQLLKNAVSDVLSSIDKARGETLSSLNSSEYGVRFESDRIIIFKGTTYDSSASTNEIIMFTSPASISNVMLGGVSGSSGNVYFSRLHGAPSSTGTVTVYTPFASKIITISAAGTASVN